MGERLISAWSGVGAQGMSSRLSPAQIYRQEAARLRSMAESQTFSHVRDGLLEVADNYEHMADQAEIITSHTFGRPLRRGSPDRHST